MFDHKLSQGLGPFSFYVDQSTH